MRTWAAYRPDRVSPGTVVATAVDEPWAGESSWPREERVLKVGRFRVRTDQGTYWRRGGRQTQLQPLPHPRRILSRAVAD